MKFKFKTDWFTPFLGRLSKQLDNDFYDFYPLSVLSLTLHTFLVDLTKPQ